MQKAYAEIEEMATTRIIQILPESLQKCISDYIYLDGLEKSLSKACDKYAAYIKIVEEMELGNEKEFRDAFIKQTKAVNKLMEQHKEIEQLHEFFAAGINQSVDKLIKGSLF